MQHLRERAFKRLQRFVQKTIENTDLYEIKFGEIKPKILERKRSFKAYNFAEQKWRNDERVKVTKMLS